MPKGDTFSVSPVLLDPSILPKNAGEDYAILNDNVPGFNLYDLQHFTGESYSPLDALGRCGPAMALLHRSMMPKEERGEIGDVKPTGWVQRKYEGVVESTPPYLYNRCHLIAYALTGQNANEKNLITGTRHFNADVMLPFEIQVMEYLEHSENHVLYRVTPYFQGTELLARGVEMEAYSVEDGGRGLCFHVFVYNTQPGITLDYATGESHAD
ncbi:MAG: DNA/RNA non-specific endonuclease [Acetatifactor sp.]|nr:DNA/RNA non-specific endonuclease [Acetatifactor sp.]